MRTVAKRLLCLLYVLLLLAALGAPSAMADDDKEYSFLSASFEVWLHEDGSATVEETWKVRFVRGQFSYYKEKILPSPNKEEAFSGISDLEVEIDGVPCTYTSKSSGGPDYSYHTGEEDGRIAITCFLKSRSIVRTYTLRYRLDNVVKEVEGEGYYVFSHRFVGATTTKAVGEVSVRIHKPDGCVVKPLYSTRGTVTESEDAWEFRASSSKGTFKVKIRLDGDHFKRATLLSKDQLINPKEESKHAKDDAEKIGPTVFIVLGGMILLMLLVPILEGIRRLIWSIKNHKQLKVGRRYEKDCDSREKLRQTVEALCPGRMSALELAAQLPTSSSEMLPLAVLAEMERDGQLERDREAKTVRFDPDPGKTEAQKIMAGVLEKCWKTQLTKLPDDERGRHVVQDALLEKRLSENAAILGEQLKKALSGGGELSKEESIYILQASSRRPAMTAC